jgi:hypothetical protein
MEMKRLWGNEQAKSRLKIYWDTSIRPVSLPYHHLLTRNQGKASKRPLNITLYPQKKC